MSTQNQPTTEPTQAQTLDLQAFLAQTEEQQIAIGEQFSIATLQLLRGETETSIQHLLDATDIDVPRFQSVAKAHAILDSRITERFGKAWYEKKKSTTPDTPEVVLSPEDTARLKREMHERFEREKAVLEPLEPEVRTLVPLLDSTDNQQRLAALGRLFEINQQLEAVMEEGRSDFSIIIFVWQLWTYVKTQFGKRKITNYEQEHVFFAPPLPEEQPSKEQPKEK